MTDDVNKAISIKYDDNAPFIAAKGESKYADEIVEMAKELGIYVHKDPQLMKHLENLKEGENIPRPLFVVIAEIIAYSYYLQGKTPESWTDSEGVRHVNRNI
jgi:type III secretion system FlhB-like substrate exporter